MIKNLTLPNTTDDDFIPAPEYTEEDLDQLEAQINTMTQIPMCMLMRFGPVGHPFFRLDLRLWPIFHNRFRLLGGLTPAISKQIGWDNPNTSFKDLRWDN